MVYFMFSTFRVFVMKIIFFSALSGLGVAQELPQRAQALLL
jgi:hypothetical protein